MSIYIIYYMYFKYGHAVKEDLQDSSVHAELQGPRSSKMPRVFKSSAASKPTLTLSRCRCVRWKISTSYLAPKGLACLAQGPTTPKSSSTYAHRPTDRLFEVQTLSCKLGFGRGETPGGKLGIFRSVSRIDSEGSAVSRGEGSTVIIGRPRQLLKLGTSRTASSFTMDHSGYSLWYTMYIELYTAYAAITAAHMKEKCVCV